MNHHLQLEGEDDDVGTCSICLLAFSPSEDDRVPRLLQCGHSFCTACLTQLPGATTPTTAEAEAEAKAKAEAEARAKATFLQCPKCRTETRAPLVLVDGEVAADIKGLPRNFDLIDLLTFSAHRHPRLTGGEASAAPVAAALECANCSQPAERFCEQCGGTYLCEPCDRRIHRFHALQRHTRVASADAPDPRPGCDHHLGKKVEMWCERDGVAICVMCLATGPHKGHDAITIEEVEQRAREVAWLEMTQVEAVMAEVEVAMETQEKREASEQESARESRAAIEQHFGRMREGVSQQERALCAEVDEWERKRAEAPAKRRNELAEAQMQLAAARTTLQQRRKFGRPGTSGDSTAACQAARTAAARATSSIIAFVSDESWDQAVASSGRLKRRRVAAAAGGVVRDYATMTVAHRTLGSGDQFKSPFAVAFDAEAGHIIVAENSSVKVHVCRADDGACIRSFHVGFMLGRPLGVAVANAASSLVVTDLSHRVHVCRSDDGSVVRTFGSSGCGPGKFRMPTGVAVDKEGNIFVADLLNNRVHVWRANDGSFLRTFGSEGTGPGQFQRPAGVAVDEATGNVVVADWGNHRVHVWRANGSFIRTFGSKGSGHGQFMHPDGVAVDTVGNIIVTDQDNHRVQVWRANGESFLRTFGSEGTGPGQFQRPAGVAVDEATGNIIVADTGNNRVQLW
jgi:DNA-binding beta-propeller fold protein YncE